MDTPDLKLLKALADTCRKSGITTFEGYGFKFTVDSEQVVTRKPRGKSAKVETNSDLGQEIEQWDNLSEEEKLYYSVGGIPLQVK